MRGYGFTTIKMHKSTKITLKERELQLKVKEFKKLHIKDEKSQTDKHSYRSKTMYHCYVQRKCRLHM